MIERIEIACCDSQTDRDKCQDCSTYAGKPGLSMEGQGSLLFDTDKAILLPATSLIVQGEPGQGKFCCNDPLSLHEWSVTIQRERDKHEQLEKPTDPALPYMQHKAECTANWLS